MSESNRAARDLGAVFDAHVKDAQAVMPSGFSAFLGKPDIPTHLVGTPDEIASLHDLVPAPNETYCHLFWPLDTSRVDQMLKARHQEREAAKKKAKGP